MSSKRKMVLAVALGAILIASLSIAGISAYFTARDRAENVVGVGNSDIDIHEDFDNPDIEPDEITQITKRVTIQNVGKNTAGVRVRVDFGDASLLDEVNQQGQPVVTVDYNTEDWEKDGEYWYYKKPILTEDDPSTPEDESVTTPLFNTIELNRPTGPQVKDFQVYVYAECRNCEDDDSLATIKSLFSVS